ncbi:lipid-A-disaccharide synthase N-terminal domain-containing protein [Ancylobacter sp. SL191]|uniref:lipid-A-disaccharide synthase N-terminal domain-containing protein n=1 Tax=Ancylobacter sp. SL191 TaxID=2995166 RepID=UPI00226F9D59|nr:lipid-A-disaccharide synthase N-terminal domain-containing protein [Ancylobacter sp. SL191]WAC28946.1 lipid-A-disaccharide synthase N-terminal domain-containing protein [Ancylobacter sp. SL191]
MSLLAADLSANLSNALASVGRIDPWLVVGFIGQGLFTARFLTQWIASERARRSIVPAAFWLFSLGGGVTLLAYALYRQDPVFIVGQAAGLLIYVRNLVFIRRERRQRAADAA